MSVARTIARNTTFNAAGRMWEAICNIVLTAYIVSKVGVAGWGLWGLISVFTGYVALFDLGMGSGFAKFIAEHVARKEKQGISCVVSTGLFFYLLFGAILIAVCWPCIDPLIELLRRLDPNRTRDLAQAAFIGDVRFLLRWGLVLFAASNCIGALSAVQTGLQRMDVTNILGFVASMIKVLATVLFLELGYGLRGLLYANAVVFAFFGLGAVVAALALVPGLEISMRCVSRETSLTLFRYGWRTQVSRLSNLVTFQTDKAIVLAVYRRLGLVGLYSIGEELAGKMRQVPALLVTALLPAASDLDARGDSERLRKLYIVSSKYVAAVTLPLVAFSVASSGLLMRVWMGSSVADLDTAAWVNRILAVGYLANILPGAGVSISLGKGRPDVQMKAGIIAMVSNILLTILLIFPFGLYGVALGTALSMFIACGWFLAAMRPVVGVSVKEVLRAAILWPALASFPGFIVCVVGDVMSHGLVGRVPNGIALCVCACVFGLSYIVLIHFAPFLNAFDVDFLENVLGLGRVPGFKVLTRRAASRV
jgi:O-antigen/teichoic acid export membrane protein